MALPFRISDLPIETNFEYLDGRIAGIRGTVFSSTWRWTTSTVSAANGQVGLNAGTWAGATQINIAELDNGNADVSNAFRLLKADDRFYLQDQGDSSKWGRYTITGPGTDQGVYWSFPVTVLDSNGTPPANNAVTIVTASAPGAQGPPGPAGPAGPAGADGIPRQVQDEGVALTVRNALNFIGGGVVASDDAANNRTNVSISGAAGTTQAWARVLKSVDQAGLVSAAWTDVTFDVEDADTDTIHDNVTNNARLTCKTAGTYEVVGNASFDVSATGDRGVRIMKNGVTQLAIAAAPHAAIQSALPVATNVDLAVNDYVTLQAYTDSSTARTVMAVGTHFSMARIDVTGPQGPQGIQGIQGNPGTPGAAGAKWWTGSGAPAGATGVVGDFYLDSASGDYYEKTGASAWTLRGNLKGPQGNIGNTGPQGPQGNPGVINAVQDEGAALTGRANLNFIGAGVTATDDAANSRTNVTIPGGGGATRVTSLPASPTDGQEVIYVADATNAILWHLRYNAGSASAYKWEFVGGSPLLVEQAATEGQAISSTVYANPTGQVTTTLALAGDYLIDHGHQSWMTAGTNPQFLSSVSIAGAVAVDADAAIMGGPTGYGQAAVIRRVRKNGLAASTAIKLQPRIAGGAGPTGTYSKPWYSIIPVRVG